MIKNWNLTEIENQLQRIYYACSDPRMDGFVTWGCKQDLYRVKFLVDELLKKCPNYSVEAKWLEELEKQKVWKTLNDKV
jgi:hypothetical protein